MKQITGTKIIMASIAILFIVLFMNIYHTVNNHVLPKFQTGDMVKFKINDTPAMVIKSWCNTEHCYYELRIEQSGNVEIVSNINEYELVQ